MKKWFYTLLLIYIGGGMALYFLQDAILFHPVQLNRNHRYDFSQPHIEINIPINETTNLNVIRFLTTDSQAKKIVLYFHGNKKNISWYAKYAPYFTKHGYEVWMIDYPGFGKSTGKLTEQILYDWAGQLYKFAKSRFPSDSIIIYGKSMGTGIAAELASKNPCQQLILETPYYDFPSVVKHYLPIYPVSKMLHYQLPTHEYIAKVTAPITIFHGTSDWIVTYSNSLRLQKLLKPGDELITIKGGSHNDLFDFRETTDKLDSLLH
ncbi:MAG: alpha/beta fold hydrolase [Bacteroidetes bacterium]|nr:alpha/beta fold hydrolase [Bacteroidota bacterium]